MFPRKVFLVIGTLLCTAWASPHGSLSHNHFHHAQLERSHLAKRGTATYPVASGDTGSSIAACYSITFSALSAANPSVAWNDLLVGEVLQMPSLRVPIAYQVASGDTGDAIASKFSILFSDLSAANPNVNWNNLQINQTIKVPGYGTTTTYLVVSGDTGDAIAASFGISFTSLAAANPNVNWNDLQISEILQIPAGTSPSQSNATTTTLPSTSSTISSLSITTTSSKAITTTTSFETTANTATSKSTTIATSSKITTSSKAVATNSTTLTSTSSSTASSSLLQKTSSTTTTTAAAATTTTSSPIASSKISSGSTTKSSTLSKSTTGISKSTTSASSKASTSSSSNSSTTSRLQSITTTSLSTTTSSKSTTSIISKSIATTATKSTTSTSRSKTTTAPESATTSSTKTTTKSSFSTTTTSVATSEPTVSQTATVIGANAVLTINNSDGVGALPDTYTFYQGNGSTAAGWPATSSWTSFNNMWTGYAPYIGTNCVGGVTTNSATETQQIYDGIQAIASASYLDHRFILAVILQESNGCVRVPTTISPPPDDITNPGLMQCFEGSGSCNFNNGNGTILNPCPVTEIFQMIEDGSMGTSNGDGLVQDINNVGEYTGAMAFYMAARLYNSGSVPANGDLGGPGATRCYASDIANRLMGWVTAARTCTLDS